MIRFQVCIFDILNTAHQSQDVYQGGVVIRFQVCIFDILNTAEILKKYKEYGL